ncbi:MAG TPA: hypothetical protein VNZ53_14370 [Steroidobacteraceae bacterium]|nr:hypothetical protein [Steroidobacteraceae bacterium]
MSAEDVFNDLHSTIDVEPKDIEKEMMATIKIGLSEKLALQYGKPWTAELESQKQEAISVLVAACKAKKLDTIRLNYTSPKGEKAHRDMDVNKISKTRSLQ